MANNELNESQLLLRELYVTSHNNDKNRFLAAYEKFVNDSRYTGYFENSDILLQPSSWREIHYEYCCCPTEWVQMNNRHSKKACNCFNGKRYIVYRIVVHFPIRNAEIVRNIIRNSGPIHTCYSRWQFIGNIQR